MRDVAREAGVSQPTVSRALRDDRRITESERVRIKAVAGRMGYRPNPFVAAFTAQVLHHRRSPHRATIALLDARPVGMSDMAAGYRLGAKERAEALGFRTEVLRLSALGGSLKRLRQVLDSRGIVGLLVLPVPHDFDLTGFNFEGLAVATVDPTLHKPMIPRAEPGYFECMHTALAELQSRGYKRAAFCTTSREVDSIGQQWLGAFTGWQALRPFAMRMVPYVAPDYSEADFGRWLTTAKPDALVVNSLFFLTWARKFGLKPPKVGFVSLSAGPKWHKLSGMDQNGEVVGAAAVDMIVTRIYRNEFGLLERPQRLVVQGTWFDGGSVRSRRVRAS